MTVSGNNLHDLPIADTCFNTGRIKIAVDVTIVYAGAMGYCVLPGTPVINVLPTASPISINSPDGSVIKSTHMQNQHPMASKEYNKGAYSARFDTHITDFN